MVDPATVAPATKLVLRHRDGLSLEESETVPGHAVLRWLGGTGTVLSPGELRWLALTAGSAMLYRLEGLAPVVAREGPVRVGEQTSLLD